MSEWQELQPEATIKKCLTVRKDGTPRHLSCYLLTVFKKETVVELTCHSVDVRKFQTSVADQFRDVTKLIGSENTTNSKIWIVA